MQRSSLYRSAVLENSRAQLNGNILLISPFKTGLIISIFCLLSLIIITFLFLSQYSRKATLSGLIAPQYGELKVYTPTAATLLEQRVSEGQSVVAGQVLFVLSGERETAGGGGALARGNASLTEKTNNLQNEIGYLRTLAGDQAQNLSRHLLELQQEMAQTQQEVSLGKQRVHLAEQTLAKFQSLQGFVSSLQIQQKQEELLDLQSRYASTTRNQMALQREFSGLKSELATLPLRSQSQISALQREISTLSQAQAENEGQRRFIVTAPASGVVAAINSHQGNRVEPNTALATLLPAGSHLEAQLYAPSSAIGFLKTGQAVYLRLHAFPYQKFGQQGGIVSEVSDATTDPSVLGLANGEPLYRVRVKLDAESLQAYGKTQYFKPGMRLEASVELDRRRIIEWLFEPLISAGKRV